MEDKKGKGQSGEDQSEKSQDQDSKQDKNRGKRQDPKSIKDKFKDLAEDIASETREEVDKLGKEARKKFEELREENKDLEEDLRQGAKKVGDKAKHVADEFATGAEEAFEDLTGPKESKRILAGVMGIIFGALGLHKFILGYTREGLIMLLVSLLSFGFLAGLMALIGLVEGIVYLSKSEEEFYNTYQAGKKPWF